MVLLRFPELSCLPDSNTQLAVRSIFRTGDHVFCNRLLLRIDTENNRAVLPATDKRQIESGRMVGQECFDQRLVSEFSRVEENPHRFRMSG